METEELFDPETVAYLRSEEVAEGLVKRVVREGTLPVPEDVTIIWALKEGRTVSGVSFQKYSAFVYKLGKKGTSLYNHCEYLLFNSMKRGEECWALVPPTMHQIGDHTGEPLWFRLCIEEFLEDIPETTPSDWSFPQRKTLALQCIEIGNRLFGTRKLNHTTALYNRAIQVLQMKKDMLAQLADEDKEFIEATSIRCWRNAAATELKASDLCKAEKDRLAKFTSTINYCKKVTSKKPHDLKALYLMAKAHMLRDEHTQCREIIASCPPPIPDYMSALLQEITRKEQHTQISAKAKMSRMFDKNVWEEEEKKELEFIQEMDRKLKLDERNYERERTAAREAAAKSAMEVIVDQAQRGFEIDLNDPGEEGEQLMGIINQVSEEDPWDQSETVQDSAEQSNPAVDPSQPQDST